MDRKSTKLYKLGRNIFKSRKAKKLTQEKLAEMLGISRDHIAKFETAQIGLSLELLFKIAEALEVSEKDLFDFD